MWLPLKPPFLFLVAASAIVTAGILIQPLARRFISDPREYCDHEGTYYVDTGAMFDQIGRDGYTVGGFEYAFVCNVNDIPVDQIRSFPLFKRLGVTRGNIRSLPPQIGKLTTLTFFQLQNQPLKALPADIGALQNLTTLKLGGNRLQTLPPEIGQLKNLEILHLYGNQLRSLPAEIGDLPKLRILDLHDNALPSLPDEIGNLSPTLTTLYLGGNRLSAQKKQRIRQLLPQTDIYW